jgi:peptide/nickel transport system ATP-binding protein
MPLLEVQDVTVEFVNHGKAFRAVDQASLTVEKGETLALVGESGSGKTTLARAILGLQAIDSGSIELDGRKVEGLDRDTASRVGIVWQDPYASLDPKWRIKHIIAEPLKLAGKETPDERIEEILTEVGLDPKMKDRFPHQLSGGQRQRVAIGRALAVRPPLILCDEPTAALDLSVQAQILNLLSDLKQSLGAAFLYISHDLSTVRYLANRVAVMKDGVLVETGTTEQVFEQPKHPYTKMLLSSVPSLTRLGEIPNPTEDETNSSESSVGL